jgi:hypothetical protein
LVNSWLSRLGGRGRGSGAGALIQIAREVVSRRRSLQGALNEVRHPGVLDAISDDDFRYLDVTIAERALSDREFALVLARLTHTAARAKGFERQTVDAALRLDSLLPSDDPSREREKLLRAAYAAAQRSGYLKGGRLTLARLGYRSLEAGDTERARALFQQQLDIAPDQSDAPAGSRPPSRSATCSGKTATSTVPRSTTGGPVAPPSGSTSIAGWPKP